MAEVTVRQDTSQEMARLAFDLPGVGAIIADPAGRIVAANDQVCEMFGYARPEFLSAPPLDLLPFGDLLLAPFSGGTPDAQPPRTVERILLRRNGTPLSAVLTLRPLPDGNLFIAVQAAAPDDGRGRPPDMSDAASRLLLQTIPFGVQFVDASGRILFSNERHILRPSGHSVGRKCWEVYKDDRKQCGECPLRMPIVVGETKTMRIAKALGDRTIQVFHTGMMYDGVPALLEIFQDVTERIQAEAALGEAELRYRSLFDNMHEGFAYCRMIFEDGRPRDFVYMATNAQFETVTGLKNVAGARVSRIIPGIQESNPELFEIYGRVALSGTPEKFESYIPSLDTWFSISAFSPAREYFVAIFDNITERKHAEQLVAQSLKEKELLLKEVHHRAKNNMQVISSMLRLQAHAVEDPSTKQALAECQDRIRSMSIVHEQLYLAGDFSKIALQAYISRLTGNLRQSYASRNLEIRFAIDVDPDLGIVLDTAIPFGLIVNELVTNAMKHAFPGPGEGTIRIQVQQSGEGFYLLRVADDGIGLPDDFHVADAKTLGLQLVRSLAKGLQGTMRIEAVKGTSVLVTFHETKYARRI